MQKFIRIAAILLCAVTLLLSFSSMAIAAENAEDIKAETKPTSISTIYLKTNTRAFSKNKYYKADMKIELADRYAKYENMYTGKDYENIQIRARGNSTYGNSAVSATGKYAFRIVLEEKCDFFGLGSSDEWYLLSNIFDATHLRNKLAYDFSATLGMYYTKSTWVRVVRNDKYMGLYQITQTLDIAKNKVDIQDWGDIAKEVAFNIAKAEKMTTEEANALSDKMKNNLAWVTSGKFEGYKISDYYDTSRLDITSGYLIEYDERYDNETTKFRTDILEIPVQLDDPVALETNPEMYKFVKDLVNDFEEALCSDTFYNSKGKHYSEYVDVDSMVDYWIVFNIYKNIEFGVYSNFFYIDGGKINFGPCWDFDNGSDNQLVLRAHWMPYDSWFGETLKSRAKWWRELYEDPYFMTKLKERWFELAPAIDEMLGSIDLYYDIIKEEAEADFELINDRRNNWNLKDQKCESFEAEFQTFRTFMYNRVAWMNEQLSLRDTGIEDINFSKTGRAEIIVSASGKTLEGDKLTVFGCASDYLLDINEKNITLSVEMKNADKIDVYVNGILLGQMKQDGKIVSFTVDAKDLDMREGAANSIMIVGKSDEGVEIYKNYTTVRVSADKNPADGEIIVKFGGERMYVKSGKTITVPEYDRTSGEMTALGWTDGKGNTYLPGEKIELTENSEFYIKWKRNEIFAYPSTINGEAITESVSESNVPMIVIIGIIAAISAAIVGIACAIVALKNKRSQA